MKLPKMNPNNIIELEPYGRKDNQKYSWVEIKITKKNFSSKHKESGSIDFHFFHCDFRMINFHIENLEINNNINIYFHFCYVLDLEFQNSNYKNLSLNFRDCVFSGSFQSPNLSNLSFDNCILRELFVSWQKRLKIAYSDTNIEVKRWGIFLKRLNYNTINELLVKPQKIRIQYCSEVSVYSINNNSHKKGCYRLPETHFHSTHVETTPSRTICYSFTEEQKQLLNIKLEILFNDGNQSEGFEYCEILHCRLSLLGLSGRSKGEVKIENTQVNQLTLNHFSPQSESTIIGLRPHVSEQCNIKIAYSNLSHLWLANASLNKYEYLNISHSVLVKTSFSSCNFDFSKIISQPYSSIGNEETYNKDLYEVLLQLKAALQNTGNIQEVLKLDSHIKKALQSIPKLNKCDRFILCVNKLSNNHGLSIVRPFAWFLLVSIGFYISYLISLDKMYLSVTPDWKLVAHYFTFIDFTHKSDFLVSKEDLSNGGIVLDYVNKLFAGFFIYQFIAAFRKYGKK